jgi:uncharacterized protein YaiL (DUF2058 family)
MADSDDWENACDDALDDAKQAEDAKKAAFADEDAVDSDEERKVKAAEAKRIKEEEAKKPKVTKKDAKDYDRMFEERNKIKRPQVAEDPSKKLSNEEMSRRTEEDITE